ncbi:MAG: helix-turn-helix transcriptional regulator [Lachnospiraceae bacterium]|nr:helix-turn-helix transcriptional regulator [Lachnospiraceae bacterium]
MVATSERTTIRRIFSKNLCSLMEQKSITRRSLSRDLDIKYTTLCDWINGRTVPREDQLNKISRYFGIEVGEFFIDTEQNDDSSKYRRLSSYLSETRRLDMNVLDHMSDENIRDLIQSGFTFEHKKLEEYVKESGGKLIVSDEIDWGQPVGREIW